jgi:purine-binding chemotaxis protein CheW
MEPTVNSADGAAPPRALAALAGKYMTFKLAEEAYGLEILRVREIIRFMEVTRVPRTREFIRGVINLRGKVIPVVDLRLKLGLESCATTEQSVIIVLNVETAGRSLTMGVLVDEVLEVLSITEAQIEPPPPFGAGALDTSFLLGVGKAGDRVLLLVDIGRVLTGEDASDLVLAAA